MDERERRLSEVALASPDYRSFLAGAFEAIGTTQRRGKFSHAAFARKAGFKSRGFAQEVVSGRKRITVTSFPKFEKALQLPRLPNAIFKNLVRVEEPEFNDDGLSLEQIAREIEELRGRLRTELTITAEGEGVSKKLYGHRQVLSVHSHPAKIAYLETLADLVRSADEDFSHPEKVFVHSYFSVDPRRLPELKKRLWNTILDFIDEYGDDGQH